MATLGLGLSAKICRNVLFRTSRDISKCEVTRKQFFQFQGCIANRSIHRCASSFPPCSPRQRFVASSHLPHLPPHPLPHHPLLSQQRHHNESRNVDITTGKQTFIFDTHKAVGLLQGQGFSLEQAEACVELVAQVMAANADHVSKNLVTKTQQEVTVQQLMSHMAALKKDMVILEKSEFSQLKHEQEKLRIELEQMQRHMKDQLHKVTSDVTLDISLERARAKEAHQENLKNLQQLKSNLDHTDSNMDKQITLINSRIDKEFAELVADTQTARFNLIKWAIGAISTLAALMITFWRFVLV